MIYNGELIDKMIFWYIGRAIKKGIFSYGYSIGIQPWYMSKHKFKSSISYSYLFKTIFGFIFELVLKPPISIQI